MSVTAKRQDRAALLRDAEYFASELVRRLESLADIERNGQTYTVWQQAAALSRGVRKVARQQMDEARRNTARKAKARA